MGSTNRPVENNLAKKTPTKNNLNELKDLHSGKLMPYGERRHSSEFTSPMPFLTTKTTINIYISNIRTMLEIRRTS